MHTANSPVAARPRICFTTQGWGDALLHAAWSNRVGAGQRIAVFPCWIFIVLPAERDEKHAVSCCFIAAIASAVIRFILFAKQVSVSGDSWLLGSSLTSPPLCFLLPSPPANKAEKRSQKVVYEPSLSSQFWVNEAPSSATVLQLFVISEWDTLCLCYSSRTHLPAGSALLFFTNLAPWRCFRCHWSNKHPWCEHWHFLYNKVLLCRKKWGRICSLVNCAVDTLNWAGKPLHSCSTALNRNWYIHCKQNLSNV